MQGGIMNKKTITHIHSRQGGEAQMHEQRLPWIARWVGLFGLLFLLQLPVSSVIQQMEPTNPYRVKAAFIRNFARYVIWPSHVFSDEHSPWKVGILGADPFGDILEKTFKGRKEQERSFEIYRAETLDKLPPCQIIIITYKNAAKRRSTLVELKNRPVLTVGDTPDFLQEGGIICFQVGDYVTMSVNLDQARSVSLKIQTKMLEVAREVVENGTVVRRR
jgi:hypothetical protein